MKGGIISKHFIFIMMLGLAACNTMGNPSMASEPSETKMVRETAEILQKTAVFEAAVSERLTENAPPPSMTFTHTPDYTFTPTATNTPAPTNTPEVQPTSGNPWMLQAWCETHSGCTKYKVENNTSSWLQIELKNSETGESGYFSVRKSSSATITLMRGQYEVNFTWGCNNRTNSRKYLFAAGNYLIKAKCPSGVKIKVLD